MVPAPVQRGWAAMPKALEARLTGDSKGSGDRMTHPSCEVAMCAARHRAVPIWSPSVKKRLVRRAALESRSSLP